jgi:hypothetical protein
MVRPQEVVLNLQQVLRLRRPHGAQKTLNKFCDGQGLVTINVETLKKLVGFVLRYPEFGKTV